MTFQYDSLVTSTQFELNFPNEKIKEFSQRIETKILQIKKNCKYLLPEWIFRKFKRMAENGDFIDTMEHGESANQGHTHRRHHTTEV